MSFLSSPGELSEVPLAAVLIEALNQRVTGCLTVEHGGGASRVFVRDGIPVGALSFAGFRPLGHLLLAQGAIDVGSLERSLSEMARTGRRQGELLVEMGAASAEQVDRALSEQQASYLSQVAALTSGRFELRPGPVPSWTAGIRISPLRAIVEALEKPQASSLVVAALQPVAGGPVALAPGYERLASAFGWSARESALVGRLQNHTTLEDFFAEPGVAPERARAILSALLLLGLAASPGAAPGSLDAPGAVVELADLAGTELDPEPPRAAAAPPPAAAPARRSDPEEARRRRQRLLQRAMQNMGVGPLAAARPSPAAGPGARASDGPAASTPTPTRTPPTPAELELRRAVEAAAPRARATDLFERLGIPRTATRDEVKAAYLQIAKALHPDRFATPGVADLAPRVKDLFAAFNEAYDLLSDDRKRTDYLARTGAGAGRACGPDADAAAVDFQKAEACARTRDFARARGFYEAALRGDPRPEYQAAFAWALLNDPVAPDRARARALAEAAGRDPACDRAALVLGILARDDGEDAAAERLFRRALTANPRLAEAARELRAIEARRDKGRMGGLGGLFRKR